MKMKVNTQVQSVKGLVFNVSFKAKSADEFKNISDQIYNAGFRPVNYTVTDHQKPQAIKESSIAPATSRFNGKATPTVANSATPKPDKTGHSIDITKISVQAVQRGPNIGNPKWFIETDTDIKFCVFDLDVLVSGRYITRTTAMSEAWQKPGNEISIDPPLPALIRKPGRYWELIIVSPPQEHKDKLYPPEEFKPENVVEIVDIEMERKKDGMRDRVFWHGKTDDLEQTIPIMKQHREHIHGIGIDTSTWEIPEPYTKSFMLNIKDEQITHIMTQDGVWTASRHHKKLLNGDKVCHRDQDGEIHYLAISKIETRQNSGPSTITFEGDHPTIDDTFDTFYVCLTPIPKGAAEEIPF